MAFAPPHDCPSRCLIATRQSAQSFYHRLTREHASRRRHNRAAQRDKAPKHDGSIPDCYGAGVNISRTDVPPAAVESRCRTRRTVNRVRAESEALESTRVTRINWYAPSGAICPARIPSQVTLALPVSSCVAKSDGFLSPGQSRKTCADAFCV